MNGITVVGEEFCGDFEEMLEWMEWYILEAEEFSQLKELCIIKCPKLVGGLPKHMPSWVSLEIRECSALMTSLPRTSATNKLALDGCDGVELGWQGVSSLVKLEISNMPNLKELPLMLTSLLVKRCEALDSVNACLNTCLQKLRIENCSSLLSVGVLPITLNSISIWECPKLVFSVSEEMECRNSSLEHLPAGFFWKLRHPNIANCEILSIPNGHGLNISTSHESVYVNECNSMVSCLQEALHAPNLKTFWVENCKKLKLLPEGMHSHLPSLEYEAEDDDDVLESFLEEALLPHTLNSLSIIGSTKSQINQLPELSTPDFSQKS
ncbi:hypothetical protein CsSME_00011811 [Camellia sinensis var. sinensis]